MASSKEAWASAPVSRARRSFFREFSVCGLGFIWVPFGVEIADWLDDGGGRLGKWGDCEEQSFYHRGHRGRSTEGEEKNERVGGFGKASPLKG